ncbi:MAG: glucose-6-phosphate dehydrogenase assembly protein OpcA [Solirubrobacteraceae bacterium]
MSRGAPAGVTDTVWSEQDTTPGAVESALRELLLERHAESASVPARVLNLICIVDKQWSGEIANRLRRVGRYHASRTIVCSITPGRKQIDATVSAASAREHLADDVTLTVETVVLELGPQHLPHLDTILDPLVVTDIATVVWAPHGHWEAVDALSGISQVVLLDSVDEPEVAVALRRARALLEERHIVDLAWLRSTPWRERIAAAFDPPPRRGELAEICALEIRHHAASGAAALLLVGWLASRLEWKVEALDEHGSGSASGTLGGVSVRLEHVKLDVPGLSGVTLRWNNGGSLSLDRGPGGLSAVRQAGGGEGEQRWRVIGASRGEGGILGEGIRQALLRDPIYSQALDAATELLV